MPGRRRELQRRKVPLTCGLGSFWAWAGWELHPLTLCLLGHPRSPAGAQAVGAARLFRPGPLCLHAVLCLDSALGEQRK